MRDRLVFFPDRAQISTLVEELSPLTVLRIRQIDVEFSHPAVVHREAFRTSCVELLDDDALLAGMSRSSRQQIRRVERLGDRVEVRCGGVELARDFRRLYLSFVRSKRHTHPLSARRISEYLTVSDLWTIRLDGVLYCGRLILRDDEIGRVRNLYEANRRFDGPAVAKTNSQLNRFLDLQAMRHYRDLGYTCFDWGGAGPRSEGPSREFKHSMGGDVRVDHGYVLTGRFVRGAFRTFARLR